MAKVEQGLIYQYMMLGSRDIHILRFQDGNFESFLADMERPLIDINQIIWMHLPIFMQTPTRKLQFNLQIENPDLLSLSQNHHSAFPAALFFMNHPAINGFIKT